MRQNRASILLALLRALVAASANPDRPRAPEAAAYLLMGRAAADARLLNRRLRSQGYPPARNGLQWGGGGYGGVGGALFGGEGQGGGATGHNRRFETTYGAGSGSLNVARVVYGDQRMRLYPMVGIGGSGEGFSVAPHDEPFDAEAYPAAGNGGPTLRLGWGFEVRFRLFPNGGVLVGIHAGCLVTPLPFGWYGRGVGKDLPTARRIRPFVKLLIGGMIQNANE